MSDKVFKSRRSQERWDAGLCIICGKPREPERADKNYCINCADYHNRECVERRKTLHELHRCTICGRSMPEWDKRKYCERCRERARDYYLNIKKVRRMKQDDSRASH